MNTETLIHDLALQCRPVKPVGSPIIRFLRWASATILLLFVGVLIAGPKPDLWNAISEPSFIFPAIGMLCLSLISTMSAFVLTIPDQRKHRFNAIPISVVFISVGIIASISIFSDLQGSSPGLICILRVVCLSVVPALLLFYMLRKAAPLSSGLVGLLALLGTLAFSEFALQFLCKKQFWAHILIWHFLPVFALAMIGIIVGRLAFK